MDRLTFAATAALEGNTLSGVAHAFGERTLMGFEYHEFARGAFDAALRTGDARAFHNHDHNLLLGRQSSGTLRIRGEADGLHYEIDLPDTSYAADIKVLVARRDLTEMSFGIMPGKTRVSRAPDGRRVITHTSVESLNDISTTPLPAFGKTSLQLHSADAQGEPLKSQAIKARQRARKRTLK
jgi:hypothetical protein